MTDRKEIERIFREHYGPMYRLAMALLHDQDMSRDVVHDVFVSLLESDAEIPASPGYLLTAVRNRCLNHIRDCGIHQRIAALYFLDDREYDTEEWPDAETIRRMDSLVASELSEQERSIIRLRFYEGLPFRDISARMGLSQTVLFRHLRHALSVIRQKLNQDG